MESLDHGTLFSLWEAKRNQRMVKKYYEMHILPQSHKKYNSVLKKNHTNSTVRFDMYAKTNCI